MTVPQRTYTDPTMNYWQAIANMGGSDKTVRGDPGAMDALAQILQVQMGQLTPEGMAAMIKEIFAEGGKQVPVIGTQYGQAVGARTSNNSGIANANKNLQEQLSQKSISAILAAQGQAAQTAAALGNLNRTETSSPTASWMQLAPFAPALLGKGGLNLAGIAKKFLDPDGADDGATIASNIGSSSTGLNSDSYATSTGLGGYDYGLDLSGGFDAGSVDYGYGLGAGSDGIDLGGFDVGSWDSGSDLADFDYEGFDLGFADGGLVSKKKIMGKANKKPKGYAEGGRVSGPGNNLGDPSKPIRGITYNGQDQSLVPMIRSITGMGDGGAGTYYDPTKPKNAQGEQAEQEPGTGAATDVPSVVGTPQENAAAVAGLLGFAVSTALGIPGIVPSMAMTALGIPNSSMSPVGKSMSLVQSLLSQMISPDAESDTPPSIGEAGMSTVGPTGAGMSTTANASQGLTIGLDSIASPVDGIAAGLGVGSDGIGGGSSGGTDGVGDAAAAGVGGGGFKKGGKIKGPGTETSDSIPIEVSDGEYVLNAEATEMFLPVVEMMNAIGLHQRSGGTNGAR